MYRHANVCDREYNAEILVINVVRSRYRREVPQVVRTRAGAFGSRRRCPESFPDSSFHQRNWHFRTQLNV